MGKWPQAALAAGLVLLADQLSKWLVLVWLAPVRRIEVIPGFFDLRFAMNTGVAFSLFSGIPGPWRVAGLSAVAFVAVLVIFFLLLSARPGERFFIWGLSLVSSGAVANVIDRLRLGAVIDFLDFYLGPYHWPAFNLADAFICLGTGLVIIHLWTSRRGAPG